MSSKRQREGLGPEEAASKRACPTVQVPAGSVENGAVPQAGAGLPATLSAAPPSAEKAGAGAGAASPSTACDSHAGPDTGDIATHISSDPTASVKREDYISWDDYFTAIAFLSAMRSKDPSTQVGACIVNPERRIVGIGYNGFPAGCSDDALPWGRQGASQLDTKYPYVVHAEVNAILNSRGSVAGCTLYVALFPCNECAKLIIQSGIREVVYLSDKKAGSQQMVASRRMLSMAGVHTRQHTPARPKLLIDFGAYI